MAKVYVFYLGQTFNGGPRWLTNLTKLKIKTNIHTQTGRQENIKKACIFIQKRFLHLQGRHLTLKLFKKKDISKSNTNIMYFINFVWKVIFLW